MSDECLYVKETYLNASGQRYIFGESDVVETSFTTPGEVYRYAQKEYGRCVSKVYVDQAEGPPKRIGWVFVSRQKYEDTGDPYLREVWVEVHTAPPTRTVTEHYASLD